MIDPAGRRAARILLPLLLASAVTAFGQNRQAMIPLSSPVYVLCKALFLEQGMSAPFPSYPWAESELEAYLGLVDYDSLSTAGRESYRFIVDALKKEPLYEDGDGFAFDAGLKLCVESYLRIPIEEPEGSSPEDYAWAHGYERRLPLLDIPLEAWALDRLYATIELEAKEERLTVDSPSTPEIADNHWNVFDPENPQLDIYFPFRAFTSTGGEHWAVELGRDRMSWGNGNAGNLVLSDYTDYYDLLSVSAFWKSFKYSAFVISLEPFSPKPDAEGEYAEIDVLTFLGHRFEIKILDRINLAVFETIVSTLTGSQTIKELNSLNIYHNWLAGDACYSIAALELSANPWRYINIYGQVALDEFMTGYEAERKGGGGVAKIGALVGLEGLVPLGKNYLRLFFECSKTDPYLYHRKADPYHYSVREIWSLVTDDYEYIVKPIGHRYGPDMADFFFKASYSWLPKLDLALDIDYLLKGETNLEDEYDKTGGGLTSPSGLPAKTLTLHAQIEYRPWASFAAGMHAYFVSVQDLDHVAGRDRSGFEWICYLEFGL